ncbi:DUF885 domain-containing protein [Ornithinimicrobium faecis]|uniref:DUF885 domain-containing protein n=1 Tax=Ornithinimicrobium faecis TaxID=2934158 RepID=A0ABY4YXD2_9MICO|nr:DUF885 domain-containing protein [Ornithinimicrobium sp. HY1793]USQ81272.1 DUF885 domain-containing protein [Ornithinimicrobium sp. HY1793]
MSTAPEHALAAAQGVLDDTWATYSRSPFIARDLSGTLSVLPDIGLEEATRKAREGQEIQRHIAGLDIDLLPSDVAVTVAAARTLADRWAREEDWHWLASDPLGVGFYGMFAPTAYSGGFVLNTIHETLDQVVIDGPDDADRHLSLIGDYARLIRQLTERTKGQAERGIYLPAPQLGKSVQLVRGLKEVAGRTLRAAPERSSHPVGEHVERRITTEVEPAFDELLHLLDDPAYAERAPEQVGISQYPGGEEIYAELVRVHTTLDLTVEQVHDRGHTRMARIHEEMRDLMSSAGFAGSPQDYLASLHDDPRWRASTPDEIAAHFQRYIDRLAPEIDQHFGVQPDSPYGVAALPEAVSGSMTFGYYSVPQVDRNVGLYMFNAVNLAQTALPMIAALNYHELVPGHHFHMASQREAQDLHPLRKHSFINAFNEGWAEYAARFAGEIGMYREPEERFGRLVMEAFLTTRLVVDTGMNALGWDLQRARDYMNEHSFMSPVEVDSETLRYSCDLPGQALAYKLGDDFLFDLREDLRAALGESFRVSDFHDAVFRSAGLPLPLVAENVRAELLPR